MKHNKSYHSLERLPFEIRVKALVTYSASQHYVAHYCWCSHHLPVLLHVFRLD